MANRPTERSLIHPILTALLTEQKGEANVNVSDRGVDAQKDAYVCVLVSCPITK